MARAASKIRFSATLCRPLAAASSSRAVSWMFVSLPKEASAELPSRGMVTAEGTLEGLAFRATLEPDGKGGHWLKVERKLREAVGKARGRVPEAGDVVTVELVPVAARQEPEPAVPPDLRSALAAAPAGAQAAWSNITPLARRDWIQWITSGKRAETRTIRIAKACDMLAQGKRRPCCFDRSGMYGKGISGPVAADTRGKAGR